MTAALDSVAAALIDADDCAACGHPTAAHDAISLRYCAGTRLNALTRTCICPQAT